jgi:hypothetical protein
LRRRVKRRLKLNHFREETKEPDTLGKWPDLEVKSVDIPSKMQSGYRELMDELDGF